MAKNKAVEGEQELLAQELALSKRYLKELQGRRIDLLVPNAKQREYMESFARETVLSGPEQHGGKTTCSAMLAAIHLSGDYPSWWKGPVFKHPVSAILCGKTLDTTRDHLTTRIFGPAHDRGTGFLPRGSFEEKHIHHDKKSTDHIAYAYIPHKTNGIVDGLSSLVVMSFEAGWQRIAGYTAHLVVTDEEPDMDIYDQLTARTQQVQGLYYNGLAPRKGWSEYWWKFWKAKEENHPYRKLIIYRLEDATHVSIEAREETRALTKGHPDEDAKLNGMPTRGTGLIYSGIERAIVPHNARLLEPGLAKVIGLDLPYTNNGTLAAVKMVVDLSTKKKTIVGEYKNSGLTLADYYSGLVALGGRINYCAWPHDGARTSGIGDHMTVVGKLKELGLLMLPEHAHIVTVEGKKSNHKDTAITAIQNEIWDGTFEIFDSCHRLIEEMKQYYHEDGKVVKKQEDHLIDAMHKAWMMARCARPDIKPGRSDLLMMASRLRSEGTYP